MSAIASIPRIGIEIDGKPLAAEDLRSLIGLRIQQKLSVPALCEITLQDPPRHWLQGDAIVAGAKLEITAGSDASVFSGEVTGIEYSFAAGRGRTLRIRGYDKLHRLRKRQPVRAFAGVTVADLASELVSDLGLSIEAVDPGPLWQKLLQHGQSDFDLLVDLAERCGLYLALRDESLHLVTLAGVGGALPLELGRTMFECEVEINADVTCREVSASAWDPSRVEIRHGKASSARAGRTSSASANPDSVGGTGKRTLVGDVVRDDAQADAIAQSELDRRAAQEVTLHGVCEGNADLRAGTPIDVSGLNEALDGRYVVTSVVHQIDHNGGFLSEIWTTPPKPRARSSAAVVAWGVVTSVGDPDALGRVKVSLPAWADVESDWLGVVAAGAGAGKGMVSLPDVKDQVLVLFANDDRAQGVVIGGLYGVNAPPDQGGVVSGAIKRYSLQTPGGQRVQLDDVKKSLRLQTADGNFCEMSPREMKFHAKTPLTIEAPGHTITIRGAQIKFEHAD